MSRFVLHGAREREAACQAVREAPDLWRVEVREPRRSDEQSAAMWAMISDIMKQKPDWFAPGLDKDEIKQVFMSGLFKELKMARNCDGDGYVPITRRSSQLSWREMNELLEYIAAWGARHGVQFNERRNAA